MEVSNVILPILLLLMDGMNQTALGQDDNVNISTTPYFTNNEIEVYSVNHAISEYVDFLCKELDQSKRKVSCIWSVNLSDFRESDWHNYV